MSPALEMTSLNAIVSKLTLDTGLNDYLVHKYICVFLNKIND